MSCHRTRGARDLRESLTVGFMEPVYTPVIWVARALFAAQGLEFTITGAQNIPTRGGAVLVVMFVSLLFGVGYGAPTTHPVMQSRGHLLRNAPGCHHG